MYDVIESFTEDDEGVQQVVLHGIPPRTKTHFPLGMALDLFRDFSGDRGHDDFVFSFVSKRNSFTRRGSLERAF